MQQRLTFAMFLLCLFGSFQVQGQEETKSLGFLKADSLTQQGKIAEARALYRQIQESYQRQKQWTPYVEVTIALATSYLDTEDFHLGISSLDNALKQPEINTGEKAHLQALLYNQIATLYEQAYEYELAIEAREHQLQTLRLAYTPDSNWDFVNAYTRIGNNLRNLGEPEAGIEYLLKAKEKAARLGNTDLARTRDVYRSIGYLHLGTGNYEAAVKTFEKGLEIASVHPQRKVSYIFYFYLSLAIVYRNLGEYQEASLYFEKGLSIILSGHPIYGNWYFYNFLAGNYMDLGQLDKAQYYYDKALKLSELDPPVPIGTIKICINLSCNYRLQKQYDKALSMIQKADSLLQIQKQKGASPREIFHYSRGIKWYTAKIWEEMGELQKAKYFYHDLLAHYTDEKNKFYDAETLKNLAAIYEMENKLDSAVLYNQKAIIAICKTFESTDPSKLPTAEDLREITEVYEVLKQKIRFSTKRPGHQDNHDSRREALEVVALADQYHNVNLQKMNLLRGGRNGTILDYSAQIYLQGFNLAGDFYEQTNNSSFLNKSFYYTQKMKAQQLWLTLLESEASSLGNLPDSLLEQERDLLANIQYYEGKVLEAKEKEDTVAAMQYKNKYLFDYQKQYRNLIRQMETDYPDYYASKYNFIPETEASLQQLLDKDELLIEYVLADTALFIFTLTQNEPLQLTKVPLANQTAEQIQDFHQHLQKSSWMRRSNREQFVQMSHALYQQFLKPIESQITQHQRLIIIGDGMTNYIPFEALLASAEVKPYRELDYLIRHHEISYHYSATLLAKARKKETTSTQGIYAFAPVYETTLSAPESVAAVEGPAYSQLRAYRKDGTFAPLPESEKEVQNVVELFYGEGIEQNTLALRADANEANLKSALEKPYRFMHIAGHSFADTEHPKFSGIACFEEIEKDSTLKTEDGILYTGEIYNISSQADLVALSSCESGYGKLDRSEGLLGLNRAFIYAGTPNVLFSLWKVYDKVNADLMVDFYQEVLNGKSYAAGLRQAKLNLLDQEVTAAPHFWSPYLLIGR